MNDQSYRVYDTHPFEEQGAPVPDREPDLVIENNHYFWFEEMVHYDRDYWDIHLYLYKEEDTDRKMRWFWSRMHGHIHFPNGRSRLERYVEKILNEAYREWVNREMEKIVLDGGES